MNDVAEQIHAWAEAVASVDTGSAVRGDEIVVLAGRRGRRRSPRLLAVAAALVFVAVLAGLVALTSRDAPRSMTTGPTTDPSAAGAVAFELLTMAEGASLNDLGVLRSASSPAELASLWRVAGAEGAVPGIDFDQQVVVSITIPDDACPPTLEAFERTGTTITPRFVEPTGGCDEPLIPKTYVAALDWSTTGRYFRLTLPGQPDHEFGDTFLEVGGEPRREGGATATFHLSAVTMVAGTAIAGTVQVSNRSPDDVETTTCGPYFVAVLHGDAADQGFVRPRCAEPFVIPLGRSSYPVTAKATYLSCVNGEAVGGVPACLPDGSLPPLPPGTYDVRIRQAADRIPVSGSVTVSVTRP